MNRIVATALALALASAVVVPHADAACMNRFVVRTEAPRQVLTILTGRFTFQEAQALSSSITKKTHPPLEWVDQKGRTIAKQFGDLKVVRPMPVGCDGRLSGVVMTMTILGASKPSKSMLIKLDETTTLKLDQQAN